MNENTPTPLEIPIHRMEADHPVDADRLRLPLTAVIGLVTVLLGGAATISIAYYRAASHAENRILHADEEAVVRGGGVAYKADVAEVRRDFEKTLRRMTLHCKRAGEGLSCSVALPEAP